MRTFIATNPEELKEYLTVAVQQQIKLHDSQSQAARHWNVPQSVVNEIANDNARCSSDYLLGLLMMDGLTIKVELFE